MNIVQSDKIKQFKLLHDYSCCYYKSSSSFRIRLGGERRIQHNTLRNSVIVHSKKTVHHGTCLQAICVITHRGSHVATQWKSRNYGWLTLLNATSVASFSWEFHRQHFYRSRVNVERSCHAKLNS